MIIRIIYLYNKNKFCFRKKKLLEEKNGEF